MEEYSIAITVRALTALGVLSLTALCLDARAAEQPPRPAAVYPVMDQYGYLAGASSAGKWLDSDEAAKRIAGGEKYAIYAFDKRVGTMTGHKPESPGAPCPDQWDVYDEAKELSSAVIGIAAPWNALPRLPRVESVDQSTYVKIVRGELIKLGIKKPTVHIDQIIRCDLDGDGTDTVLISAHVFQPESFHPAAGNYSIVIARQIVNGTVKTVGLTGEAWKKTEPDGVVTRYTIAGIYDLNGDGRMEVVITWRYYEGAGTEVYTIRNGAVDEVLETGCGA